jgi:S1-C subfamily serine protease
MARGGRLGVTVQTLSDQLQEYFGAKEGGALVSSVAKESAAEKAGLKAGDVIVSINGDKVRDAEELTSEIGGKSGEITIGIVRDKKASTLKATIESRTERPRPAPRPGLQPAAMVRPV